MNCQKPNHNILQLFKSKIEIEKTPKGEIIKDTALKTLLKNSKYGNQLAESLEIDSNAQINDSAQLGPYSYTPSYKITKKNTARWSIGKSKEQREVWPSLSKTAALPGPGNYSYVQDKERCTAIIKKEEPLHSKNKSLESPGPGSYDIENTTSMPATAFSRSRKRDFWSVNLESPFIPLFNTKVPGPGFYHNQKSKVQSHNSAIFT